MRNFQPLEVVDRGSETQLQLGENAFFYATLQGLMRKSEERITDYDGVVI